MSTLTAGIFAFSFSSCTDETDSPNTGANNQQAPEGAKTELLEAYSLTFENYSSAPFRPLRTPASASNTKSLILIACICLSWQQKKL